jgi:hypothetical protein
MAIISLAEAKTLAGIPVGDTTKDALISLAIEEVEADYLTIRNLDFDLNEAGEIVYPPGSKLVAADMLAWVISSRGMVGVSSRSIEGVSETMVGQADLVHGYPRQITARIKQYARVWA